MDLIWGHRLGNRRETQEIRVFKYADRGFGLRILPSYVRSLDKHNSEDTVSSDQKVTSAGRAEPEKEPSGPTRVFEGEPGLKTLKRISYLAKGFVHRYCFGPSKVLNHTEPRKQSMEDRMGDFGFLMDEFDEPGFDVGPSDEGISDEDAPDDDVSDDVESAEKVSHKDASKVEESESSLSVMNESLVQEKDPPPLIRLCAMDGYKTYEELPNGRKSLGVFELLMRHSEAWRLDALGLARLDRTLSAEIAYDDLGDYNGMPSYTWGFHSGTSVDQFMARVYDDNYELFQTLRRAVAEKLNIDPFQGRYVDYLTRRIRRVIVDRDLESVQAKQITMPLLIPLELETFIAQLAYHHDDLPNNALSELLIPAHDPSKHDPSTATMPSLHDCTDESGNLRYWLVTNKSMWAGQHWVLDEVAELLAALFDWFESSDEAYDSNTSARHGTDNPECLWHLAKIFRRRLILPETSNTLERGQLLPEREARLFRAWVMARPPKVQRIFDDDDDDEMMQKFQKELEMEGDIPDKLFWKDGDEGTWDSTEGVPVWQD
ncbi:MAG: hypothetical protein Q9225_007586 [Loekoesia sp. 1 TL-2023]